MPRLEDQARTPNGDNYRPILALAHEVLNDQAFTPDQFGDFVEAVKCRCAALRIDYGRHPDVSHDVVHRACAAALVSRLKTRSASASLRPPRVQRVG